MFIYIETAAAMNYSFTVWMSAHSHRRGGTTVTYRYWRDGLHYRRMCPFFKDRLFPL